MNNESKFKWTFSNGTHSVTTVWWHFQPKNTTELYNNGIENEFRMPSHGIETVTNMNVTHSTQFSLTMNLTQNDYLDMKHKPRNFHLTRPFYFDARRSLDRHWWRRRIVRLHFAVFKHGTIYRELCRFLLDGGVFRLIYRCYLIWLNDLFADTRSSVVQLDLHQRSQHFCYFITTVLVEKP